MFKLKTVAFAAGLMALPAISQAAGPTLSDVLGNSGISVSGAVDVSYDWSDVDAPVTNHQFDVNPNTFSLHQVNVLLTKDFGGGVSATLNPILGDDATLIGGSDVDLFQGYLSYAAGGFTVSAGRMATLAGMEVVNPAGNTNASRGLLFFNEPFVHTGVRASYKLNDMLAFTLGVHNSGFGAGKTDGDTRKSLEAQVAFTPIKALSTYLTVYTGEGDASPLSGLINTLAPGSMATNDTSATFYNFVANYTLNDMLSFGVDGIYSSAEADPAITGGFENADTKGAAVYVTAANILPKLSVALRGEYIAFDDLGTGGELDVRSGTVTVGYAVTDALKILVEGRSDVYDDILAVVTPVSSKNAAFAFNNDVTTATVKAVLKF